MNALDSLRQSGAIRLDAEESAALAEALQGIPGEVWLFGSRVDQARRGGDVDVLLLTDQPAFETSQTVATRFFSRCEERIDVVVFDPARLNVEQQEFLNRIKRVRLA
ncbi:MAG: nucleotidyltransferase domain-containing protein [Rhodocyclaceae bacterium]|nr:nucleotidyltransferase domain-containing protein [Rhodocyclaceae bacterium]